MEIANPAIVFKVSDVSPTRKPLPEKPYREAVEALLQECGDDDDIEGGKQMIEACSQDRGQLVADIRYHPLIAAIHNAFNDHRSLCLSPDMLWLLICQGFANHINANSEQMRSKFVQHQGKVTISVRRDDFIKGSSENPWSEVFSEFSASIRSHIGDVTHDFLVPTFSTTGLIEKSATEIVLLNAMQSYFSYEMRTMCGIPQAKLEGTVDDWQQLLQRTKSLAQFGLDWWIDALIPILDQFVSASQGHPDECFWQSMYKLSDMSGGPMITGWITNFFPYLTNLETGRADELNLPLMEEGNSKSLTSDDFPAGLAKAPFRWLYFGETYEMEFLSGFIGVKQYVNDRNLLYLRPEIGWVIREAIAK